MARLSGRVRAPIFELYPSLVPRIVEFLAARAAR